MKKIICALLMTLILCLSTIPANADSMIPPMPYEIDFDEQDLVFRMVPMGEYEHNLSDPENSGLYVKSTGEKIYTVYEYYYNSDLYFSADRLSFAAMTWQETNEDKGIIFYVQDPNTEGHELFVRYYQVTNLMKDLSKKENTASHYFWNRYQDLDYDEKNSTLSIVTNDGIHYTFDIQTGIITQNYDVNEKNTFWKTAITSTLIILTGAALVLLYYVMKKYD